MSTDTDCGDEATSGAPIEDVDAFPNQLREIGAAVAEVLDQLDAVLARKRAGIVEIARAPSLTTGEAGSSGSNRVAEVEREVERVEADGDANTPGGMVATAAAHSVGLALHNTVAASQQLDIVAQAVLSRAAAELLDSSGS